MMVSGGIMFIRYGRNGCNIALSEETMLLDWLCIVVGFGFGFMSWSIVWLSFWGKYDIELCLVVMVMHAFFRVRAFRLRYYIHL